MNYDGQYYRADSLGDLSTKAKGYVHECHCHINDTFEQLAASWSKHAKTLEKGRERYKKKTKDVV